MKSKAKKNSTNQQKIDLQFVFKYVCVNCHVNEKKYSKDDIEKIQYIVKCASKHIVIDKSYVEFKENKHEDVFMLEDGWNELCDLVIKTNYCKKITKAQQVEICDTYCLMILCYIYLFLENMGYDSDSIYLEIDKNSRFMVYYEEDTIKEWKHYPGKWQTW